MLIAGLLRRLARGTGRAGLFWAGCTLPLSLAQAADRPAGGYSLIAGGDVLLARGVSWAMEATGDTSYPFTGIAPVLREADLALANLECALSDSGVLIEKQFMFRAPGRLAETLRRAGFTALSLANNHAYDCGRDGLRETVAHLARAGILSLGVGESQADAGQPNWVVGEGTRVALLAFVDMPLEGLMPLPERFGPALADPAAMVESVRQARARGDWVVVTMHWGQEYDPFPVERQRTLARQLIGAGADLIIGHHPHVIQTVERIGSGVVFYSLGNLVFDQTSPPCTEGLLLRVLFPPRADGDRCASSPPPTVEILPLRLRACRPQPAEPRDAEAIVRALTARCDAGAFSPGPDGWWSWQGMGGP